MPTKGGALQFTETPVFVARCSCGCRGMAVVIVDTAPRDFFNDVQRDTKRGRAAEYVASLSKTYRIETLTAGELWNEYWGCRKYDKVEPETNSYRRVKK